MKEQPQGLTFVIEYDHAIVYCGDSIVEAREHYTPNMGPIHVWVFGKWIGDVDYDGNWTFLTKHNEPFFQDLMDRYRKVIAIDKEAERIKAESSYLNPHHPNARGNQGIYG